MSHWLSQRSTRYTACQAMGDHGNRTRPVIDIQLTGWTATQLHISPVTYGTTTLPNCDRTCRPVGDTESACGRNRTYIVGDDGFTDRGAHHLPNTRIKSGATFPSGATVSEESTSPTPTVGYRRISGVSPSADEERLVHEPPEWKLDMCWRFRASPTILPD